MKPLVPRLERTVEYLMALALSVMVVLVFGNVVLRYLFNSGFAAAEELARLMFVWLIFLGAILALRHHGHLGVEMVQAKLPRPLRARLRRAQPPADAVRPVAVPVRQLEPDRDRHRHLFHRAALPDRLHGRLRPGVRRLDAGHRRRQPGAHPASTHRRPWCRATRCRPSPPPTWPTHTGAQNDPRHLPRLARLPDGAGHADRLRADPHRRRPDGPPRLLRRPAGGAEPAVGRRQLPADGGAVLHPRRRADERRRHLASASSTWRSAWSATSTAASATWRSPPRCCWPACPARRLPTPPRWPPC